MAHPALLYEPLGDGKVRDTACARYCAIPSGSHGFCFVRKNVAGHLELLSYGRAAAVGAHTQLSAVPPSSTGDSIGY